MTTSKIHQTLCGYERGHRLLEHSAGADLGSVAAAERISDLSGYLPSDFDDDLVDYYRVEPLGSYVAFARTWLNPLAQRRGTVFTHALLIPRELWVGSPDPWSWARLHARDTYMDREAFRHALDPEVEPLSWATQLPDREIAELVELWQRGDPVVWLSDPTLDHARALWPLLGPADRACFSFQGLMLGNALASLSLTPERICAYGDRFDRPRSLRLEPVAFAELPDVASIRQAASELGFDFRLQDVRLAERTINTIRRIDAGESTASHIVLESLGRMGTVGPDAGLVRRMILSLLGRARTPTPVPLYMLAFVVDAQLVRAQLELGTDLAEPIRAAMRELVERSCAEQPGAERALEAMRRRDVAGVAMALGERR